LLPGAPRGWAAPHDIETGADVTKLQRRMRDLCAVEGLGRSFEYLLLEFDKHGRQHDSLVFA
jgi:hypothetical protein